MLPFHSQATVLLICIISCLFSPLVCANEAARSNADSSKDQKGEILRKAPKDSTWAPERTVEKSTGEVPRQEAFNTAISALKAAGCSKIGDSNSSLVYSHVELRREWRFEFEKSLVAVSAEDGRITRFIIFRKQSNESLRDKRRIDAISAKTARQSARSFARALGAEMRIGESKGRYEDIGDLEEGDLLGASWAFYSRNEYQGVECYDSVTALAVNASDGRPLWFYRGYLAENVRTTKAQISAEEAMDVAQEHVRDGDTITKALLRIVNLAKQGIATRRKHPALCWVIHVTRESGKKKRAVFVDALDGTFYAK